jgi:predicted RNA-binding Zn ribbon-like protein
MVMELGERPAGKMKLVGGRLCLDFVNTVGGRRSDLRAKKSPGDPGIIRDKLNDYIDLLAWSLHTELIAEKEAQALVREARRREKEASVVLARAIELREAIYRICKAVMGGGQPAVSELDVLNREIGEARGHERLVSAEGGITWEWVRPKTALDQMLWPVADSAAELLTTDDLTRLRECGGENCGWLFEDTSRNRSRQWCVMEDCGNLAKVRRFRSRARRTTT